MDRDAILVVDGHEILNFARQSIPTHAPGHRINAGANGCMGVAVPYGLGAKMAKPDKQVIVLSGDGSFGMNGMEMDTAVRHKIPILVVVSNNGGWAAMGGMAGRDLGFTRYDKLSEVFGCHGEYVEVPDEIRPALEDRKSTRLNSSHPSNSYAVFCLKKKKTTNQSSLAQKKKNKIKKNTT